MIENTTLADTSPDPPGPAPAPIHEQKSVECSPGADIDPRRDGSTPPANAAAHGTTEASHDDDPQDGDSPAAETTDGDGTPPDELSVAHRKMLSEESGISDELIAARGYRTVYVKADLERLGFSSAQRNVPALLTPVYSPAGEIANYQTRPDAPRIRDGKPVKYETPKGSRMTLDVNPLGRDDLDDPNVPLFVTEGVKKGDALLTHGARTVAILGVWNWRGKNEKGGTTVLPEWDQIALNGRQVYIVFDSDVMLKPLVYAALVRLKSFLESRKAHVAVIYLPPTNTGGKQGVDDFLAAGGTPTDLLTLATPDVRKPPADVGEDPVPETQSAMLIQYAAQAELFHTPDGTAYITIPMEVN